MKKTEGKARSQQIQKKKMLHADIINSPLNTKITIPVINRTVQTHFNYWRSVIERKHELSDMISRAKLKLRWCSSEVKKKKLVTQRRAPEPHKNTALFS